MTDLTFSHLSSYSWTDLGVIKIVTARRTNKTDEANNFFSQDIYFLLFFNYWRKPTKSSQKENFQSCWHFSLGS